MSVTSKNNIRKGIFLQDVVRPKPLDFCSFICMVSLYGCIASHRKSQTALGERVVYVIYSAYYRVSFLIRYNDCFDYTCLCVLFCCCLHQRNKVAIIESHSNALAMYNMVWAV